MGPSRLQLLPTYPSGPQVVLMIFIPGSSENWKALSAKPVSFSRFLSLRAEVARLSPGVQRQPVDHSPSGLAPPDPLPPSWWVQPWGWAHVLTLASPLLVFPSSFQGRCYMPHLLVSPFKGVGHGSASQPQSGSHFLGLVAYSSALIALLAL